MEGYGRILVSKTINLWGSVCKKYGIPLLCPEKVA